MMDKRSDFQKAIGDAAESVVNESLVIKESVEQYRNSFVDYMKERDIANELKRIREEQKIMEEVMRQEEERKKKSWFYRFLCKLKKTV